VVVDGRMLEWTGIGRYTRHLLDGLADLDRDSEYVVLMSPAGAAQWAPSAPNMRVRLVDVRPYGLAAHHVLPKVIAEERPDLVHFTHFVVPLGYRGRYVVTVHDLTMIRRYNLHGGGPLARARRAAKMVAGRRVAVSAVRRAATVIADSQATAQDVVALGASPDKVEVVYLGADPAVLDATLDPLPGMDDAPFVLYVGNGYPHKNVDVLVAAMERMALQRPGLRLVVVGAPDTYSPALRRRVARGPAAGAVTWAGFVSDGRLAWLYRHAALFVLPSLAEGFGLPGLEAMAHGVPVVASRASCLPEVYGPAAAYFTATDADDLVRAVSGVLDDVGRRQSLVDAGRARVSEFSWARMAEETLAVYRRAVSAPESGVGSRVVRPDHGTSSPEEAVDERE
jgi:glycosyltransferase involved in cell wall biosynthesis